MQSSISERGSREYKSNKKKRPFLKNHAMHLTLRSEIAKGPFSMAAPRTRVWLKGYVSTLSRKMGIRLYHFSNNGSHLHLVIMPVSLKQLGNFLRVLGGRIPRRVLGAEKGKGKGIPFWVGRPYTRVLSWGRELKMPCSMFKETCSKRLGVSAIVRGWRKYRAVRENGYQPRSRSSVRTEKPI